MQLYGKRLFKLHCLCALVLLGSCGSPGPGSQPVSAPGSACDATAHKSLNIPPRRQIGTNWCWAAAGEMVMNYFNINVTQCLQANRRFNRNDCCPFSARCNLTGWPQFEVYGLNYSRTSYEALSWDQIKKEIACNDSPVAFTWRYIGEFKEERGHMMVAVGYEVKPDGQRIVYANDPWRESESPIPVDYDYYVSSSTHEHWDDFYNIRKN
ncbi:MAG TPA: C39 family peptidase [Blastocatellia bacterium]|nr:C39 family peptidase [Blastocatellia bacterium]